MASDTAARPDHVETTLAIRGRPVVIVEHGQTVDAYDLCDRFGPIARTVAWNEALAAELRHQLQTVAALGDDCSMPATTNADESNATSTTGCNKHCSTVVFDWVALEAPSAGLTTSTRSWERRDAPSPRRAAAIADGVIRR